MEILITQNQNHAVCGMSCQSAKLRERGRARIFALGLWLLLLGLGLPAARGQAVSHEYPLKAVFLLNFAHYTDWPTNAFDGPNSPLVVGVLGDDPFGTLLDDAVRDEKVNGRKIAVERYRRAEDVKTCHILFISQSETQRLDTIVAAMKGRPVLTVSEIENSAYRGVCVRFLTENNKIRLQVNLDSLKAGGLTMSSKLLRAADLIPAPSK